MWKLFANMALPMIEGAAQMYINQDANHTGKDDLIGHALQSVVNILRAVLSNDSDKITDALNTANRA